MDVITYSVCKKIAEAAVSGISSLEVEDTTLIIKTNSGQTIRMDFPTPEDGISVNEVVINENKHLICTMSNGDVIDAGIVPSYIPQKGVDYFTEEDKEEMVQSVTQDVEDSYTLEII
jgi:hypothetical protein